MMNVGRFFMAVGQDYLSTEEFAEYCCHIIDGLTTRQVAQKLGKNRTSVLQWINLHASPEQVDQYARALEMSAELMVEDGLEIVDESSGDYRLDKDGNEVLNSEHIQRSKVRADYRKWIASKRKPKKFGDRIESRNINYSVEMTKAQRDAAVAAFENGGGD